MYSRVLSRAFIVTVAAGLFVGCTGDSQLTGGRLSGTVRLKGGPLPGGEILLVDPSDPNKSQTGFIKADGSYEVLNAPIGDVKVVVTTEPIKSHPALMAGKAKGSAAGAPKVDIEAIYGGQLKYVPINPKYRSPESTPLSAQISKGVNTADFVVE